MRLASIIVVLALLLAPVTSKAEGPVLAIRAGWAYGLGAELEYRPAAWGATISGGWVPGLGSGGYAGVAWGAGRIDGSGLVAEGGIFRGVRNPLRPVDDGFGLYALVGYAFVPASTLSLRLAAGGGLPFAAITTPEFLAKLTVGMTF